MKLESSTRKKILLAVALSATCYALTHFVYVLTDPGRGLMSNREPIAYTTRVNDNVQRRPVARMIWHLLNTGEPVFPGEAIRTSSQGEVRIQFVGSDRTLDLEADTMVILTKSENEIALDLLDGSVFVAQSEAGEKGSAEKLTLNSKQGQIDLSKATASLSKSEGKVDLQVVKGEAKVEGGSSGESKVIKSGESGSALNLVEPLGDQPLFVTGLNPRLVTFKWSGAVEGSAVEIWLGKSRKELKLQSRLTQKNNSLLQLQLRPGKYFWQVKGIQGTQSAVTRFEVLPLSAPQPLSPAEGYSLLTTKDPANLEFTWSNPPGSASATFELAKDAGFKEVLKTEVVDSARTFLSVPVSPGRYHWRVSTYYPEHHQMAAAVARNLEVVLGEKKIAKVNWDPNTKSEAFFVEKPKLEIAWQEAETKTAKSWLIRFAPSEQELANPNSEKIVKIETQSQKIESLLPNPGRWVASIEGLDAQGEKVAASELREFTMTELPLLASPRLIPAEGDLTSTPGGDLRLEWTAINEAVEYQILLKNQDGLEVVSKKTTRVPYVLSELLPGTYQLQVIAKDAHGRLSKDPETRKVTVPESSGLSAPKLRRVKVK